MRSLGKCVTLFLAVLLIVFTTATPPVFGYDVKSPEKIKFSQNEEVPSILWSFCVTEDDLIIIPDSQKGNIKIFEKEGISLKLIKTIGQKGFGIDELLEPTFCFYNRNDGKFGVLDFGKREIIIYDRMGRTEFERTYVAPCSGMGFDIQLSGGNLLISGYLTDPNGSPYDLYYFDLNALPGDDSQWHYLTALRPNFLLPSYHKYGLKSPQEYDSKTEFMTIGTKGWFDVQGEDVYYAWEGDLRIIKINIESGERQTFLGEKTSSYIAPHVSDTLRNAYHKRNKETIRSQKAKVSYIRNIFASPKYLLVILEGPGESYFWMQFYDLDGNFKNNAFFREKPGWIMYFDKDKETLYSLSSEGNNTQKHFILKYKISE